MSTKQKIINLRQDIQRNRVEYNEILERLDELEKENKENKEFNDKNKNLENLCVVYGKKVSDKVFTNFCDDCWDLKDNFKIENTVNNFIKNSFNEDEHKIKELENSQCTNFTRCLNNQKHLLSQDSINWLTDISNCKDSTVIIAVKDVKQLLKELNIQFKEK